MTLDRRTLLAGAAALAATPLATVAATRPASADVSATTQVPGVYRMKLGSFQISAVTDGIAGFPMKPSVIPNADPADVAKAMEEAFMPTDTLPVPFTPLVVETGSKRILLDTGLGQFGPPTAGQLVTNLKAAGIDPKSIDMVIISHFHADHISGLRGKDGQLTFPNAEINVPSAEWAYWTSDDNKAKAPEGIKGTFAAVDRVFGPNKADIRRYDPEKEITTGITGFAAYGHTPGHNILALESDGKRMMYLADITNNPLLFARHPDWAFFLDQDAEMARVTRHRVLDMVAQERALVSGYHYAFPAVGHILKTSGGYDVQPLFWNPTL